MSAGQKLRAVGLRRTHARQIVLDVLCSAGRPLSHQEIAGQPETGFLDRVTLYRTLTTLQKVGLLHRVQGVDGIWRFGADRRGAAKCPGNHIHFLCVECNQMSCLPEQPLPWITAPEGAQIHGKQLVVYGLCPECAAQEK